MSIYRSQLSHNIKRVDSTTQKSFQELKKIKYPLLAIEPVQQLTERIKNFKNENLSQQMKNKLILQKKLNAFRKIRGDGNCFFRALAYSLLSNARNLANVEETFFLLQDISLTSCFSQSVPKQFRPFYNDSLLKQALRNNWPIDVQHFSLSCRSNNRRILTKIFRKNPYLDFIVILYFRSLCLKGLQKHKVEVRQFMKGTEQKQIRTYGQQSEGVVLDICSRYLRVQVDVYEVRKQQLKHYSYKNEKIIWRQNIKVSLLYYENHYDILENLTQQQLELQKSDAQVKEDDYYESINENMVEGECIQCGKKGFIFQQNFLCQACFVMSKNQLLNMMKENKFTTGTCRDCARKGVKVLEMIQLCQYCIQRQNRLEQSQNRLQQTQHQQNKNQKSPSKVSSLQSQIAKCLQCGKSSFIEQQTKLCRRCKQTQQALLIRRQQNNKSNVKTMCLKCNQPLTSEIHEALCINRVNQAKIGSKISNNEKFSFAQHEYKQKKKSNDYTRCQVCQQVKFQEIIIDGKCKSCRLSNKKEKRASTESYFQKPHLSKIQQSSRKHGQLLSQAGEKCKRCGKSSFTYKFWDGLCNACKNQQSNIRF